MRPRIVVSFGDLGRRNVVAILEKYNLECELLSSLTRTHNSLRVLRGHTPRKRRTLLQLKFGSHELGFVPLD